MRKLAVLMAPQPFCIPFSQPAIDDLRDRLARTRWPDEVADSDWEYGFDLPFLQEICSRCQATAFRIGQLAEA